MDRFRLSTAPAWIAGLLLLGCSRSGDGAGAPGEEPRNLILVTLDTLRADHLSCYGYFRRTSPKRFADLVRLADLGVDGIVTNVPDVALEVLGSR